MSYDEHLITQAGGDGEEGMSDVLAEHVQLPRNQRCSCGWRGDVNKSLFSTDNIYQQHRDHQAAMLTAAGFGKLA